MIQTVLIVGIAFFAVAVARQLWLIEQARAEEQKQFEAAEAARQ